MGRWRREASGQEVMNSREEGGNRANGEAARSELDRDSGGETAGH